MHVIDTYEKLEQLQDAVTPKTTKAKMKSIAILLPLAGIASAQFQFFESMFGQQHQQQHQQRTGAAQYADQMDSGKSITP